MSQAVSVTPITRRSIDAVLGRDVDIAIILYTAVLGNRPPTHCTHSAQSVVSGVAVRGAGTQTDRTAGGERAGLVSP